MKHKMIIALMVASISLTGCTSKVVPDDQRQLEKTGPEMNAMEAPSGPGKPTATPSFGTGIIPDATVAKDAPVIDNGKTIAVPTVPETIVEKNEKVILYAGLLKPETEYSAKIFYSGNGNNKRTIDLGKFKVSPQGELQASVIIPVNIAPGQYVIALDAGEGLYTAPIKVG